MTYYKVLKNGKSFTRTSFKWNLPIDNGDGTYTPGQWHEHKGMVYLCHSGFHLTEYPYLWWELGATVYEAEGGGETHVGTDKSAFSEARLIRPVEDPQWLLDAINFAQEEVISLEPLSQRGELPNGVLLLVGRTFEQAYDEYARLKRYAGNTYAAPLFRRFSAPRIIDDGQRHQVYTSLHKPMALALHDVGRYMQRRFGRDRAGSTHIYLDEMCKAKLASILGRNDELTKGLAKEYEIWKAGYVFMGYFDQTPVVIGLHDWRDWKIVP